MKYLAVISLVIAVLLMIVEMEEAAAIEKPCICNAKIGFTKGINTDPYCSEVDIPDLPCCVNLLCSWFFQNWWVRTLYSI